MSTAPSLRTTVLRGLGWLSGAQGARQAMQIGVRVLLVRLLAPGDFGLMAMVTVITGFLLMFTDLGFGPALVRKESVSERELSTVFWINCITGLLLAFLTLGLGPLLSSFYGQRSLIPLCAGLAVGSLAAPLGTVHNALLQRRLAFFSLALVDVAGIAAGGVIGVVLALRGYGVWALVWQSNGTLLATLLMTVIQARWAPVLQFHPAAATRLWSFSSHFTAASVLNYWVRNLDNLLVGRFLGAEALGFYSQAYQMMLYPVQSVAALTGRVMFPALAGVQSEPERLRGAYLRALQGIAALTFPMMLGAVVMAPDLYHGLFGPRWERSVFLFQVLCLVGMLQSIGTTIGWIYLTTGRTDLQLRWTVIAAAVVLPAFVVGLAVGGLNGLTIGYALASSLLFVPSLIVPFRLIRLPLAELAGRLAPILAAAFGMTLGILALRPILPPAAGALSRLLDAAVLGMALYVALLHCLGQQPLGRARSLSAAFRCPPLDE